MRMSFATLFVLLLFLPLMATVDYNAGHMVLQFPGAVKPDFDKDGFVTIGNSIVDSVSQAYGAVDYRYYDFTNTTDLRYILLLYFDGKKDIQDAYRAYEKRCKGIYQNIGYVPKTEYLMTPGDYLYSSTIDHPDDTLWQVYNDSEKQDWGMLYRTLQYRDSADHTLFIWNSDEQAFFEPYWGATNRQEVGMYDINAAYRWAFHGRASLWHLLPEYNDVYDAWDYSKGIGVTALVSDPNGFYINHPDFGGRWLYTGDLGTSFPPTTATPYEVEQWSIYSHRYHGTDCAGALAAGIETTNETTMTNRSSAGVAPGANLVGHPAYTFPEGDLDFIEAHPELNIKVISISHNTYSTDPASITTINRLINTYGVTIVAGRGYSNVSTNAPELGQDFDGFISVGDYRPDYRVKTYFNSSPNEPDTLNEDANHYQVEINAPGWNIFVPFAYYLPDTGNANWQTLTYGLGFGTNTSIATPQVAGTVALIASRYPWMTPAQIEQQIKLGAHHLSDMISVNTAFFSLHGRNVPSDFYGAGCLDSYSSLFLHGSFARDFTTTEWNDHELLLGKEFNMAGNSVIVNSHHKLRVEAGATAILNGSIVSIDDYAQVTIEEGATLELDNCTLSIGSNVTWTCPSENGGKGTLRFNNCTVPNISLMNTANCNVYVNSTTFQASNSTFSNSPIHASNCNFNLDSCTLSNSPVQGNYTVGTFNVAKHVNITNSTISGVTSTAAVTLWSYPQFTITGNTIQNNATGLYLHESGLSSTPGTVSNNIIQNNTLCGLAIYHTFVQITGNNRIESNRIGMMVYRNSDWPMIGNETAPWQKVDNNNWEEILFTPDSAPLGATFYYNEIYDGDTGHDYALMRCSSAPDSVIDVSNNYWGTLFNPNLDLLPAGLYEYLPIWNPGTPRDSLNGDAEAMYSAAVGYQKNGSYLMAKTTYEDVIAQFPNSKYAKASANALIEIQKEVGSSNYADLQAYYLRVADFTTNADLQNICNYLANYCNIERGDYPSAIAWFESIIENPPSFADSVFAAIDAGYTYMLMETDSTRCTYHGKIAWLKPKSAAAFEQTKADLLASLWNNTEKNDPDVPTKLILSQNFPNPFNPTTTIAYSLPKEGKVTLSVYNLRGQLVKQLVNESQTTGKHQVLWNGTNNSGQTVATGVYFYRLETNHNVITKKMLLMK